MKKLLSALLILTAGCSSGSSHAASSPTPSLTPELSGTVKFLAWSHAASFGNKDFASAPDGNLLNVGNTACDELSSGGLTFGRIVQGYVESNAHPSVSEAEAFTREAVTDLCPDQQSKVP